MMSLVNYKNLLCLMLIVTGGCSSKAHKSPHSDDDLPTASTVQPGAQPDLIPVLAALHDQMHSWQGTPYHWGGTNLKGVDCSGFVWRTLKDRFNIPMERVTTKQLVEMGKPVDANHLQTGDLVFFQIHHQLHVGFYDTQRHFLHASYSKGVIRSSLDNPYWQSVFYRARRLKKEYGAEISFNHDEKKIFLASK